MTKTCSLLLGQPGPVSSVSKEKILMTVWRHALNCLS